MEPSQFIDEFRPFRRGELALARALTRDALALSPADVDVLRYALRLAQLSSLGDPRDSLVEPLAEFRLRLVQILAPIMPTGPEEMDEQVLRTAVDGITELVDAAHARVRTSQRLSAEELDAEISHKRLVLVLGGAGGCGYVYLGVLQRLAELSIEPSYLLGCSMGAILAVLRARSRHFDLDELLEEMRLLRAVAALAGPTRSRFGLPGSLRIDLHRALGPLFTNDDGTPVSLGDLALPVDALATGIGVGALPLAREEYGTLVQTEHRSAEALSKLSGSAVARTVGAMIALAMSRRLLVPILFGAEEETRDLSALDAAGFSSAIPVLLSYELPEEDQVSGSILERVFERNGLTALCDGLVSSAIPAHWAWERVEGGLIGSRNCVIVALHALEASQGGAAGVLLSPVKRVFAGTAHRDRPFWDLCVNFTRAPGVFDLLPGEATLREAAETGREAFEEAAGLLPELMKTLPPWHQIVAKRGDPATNTRPPRKREEIT